MRKKLRVVLRALKSFLKNADGVSISKQCAESIMSSWEKGLCPLLGESHGVVMVTHPGGGCGKGSFVQLPVCFRNEQVSELNELLLVTAHDAGLNWRKITEVWNKPKDRSTNRINPAHECEQLKNYQRRVELPEELPVIEHRSQGPTMVVKEVSFDNSHMMYEIGFCPFCGVKLTDDKS